MALGVPILKHFRVLSLALQSPAIVPGIFHSSWGGGGGIDLTIAHKGIKQFHTIKNSSILDCTLVTH